MKYDFLKKDLVAPFNRYSIQNRGKNYILFKNNHIATRDKIQTKYLRNNPKYFKYLSSKGDVNYFRVLVDIEVTHEFDLEIDKINEMYLNFKMFYDKQDALRQLDKEKYIIDNISVEIGTESIFHEPLNFLLSYAGYEFCLTYESVFKVQNTNEYDEYIVLNCANKD